MKAHNAVFTVDDGADRYRVIFDLHEQEKGKRWTVYVSVNGVVQATKEFHTSREPNVKNARYFANKY